LKFSPSGPDNEIIASELSRPFSGYFYCPACSPKFKILASKKAAAEQKM
jgi:hypothetical protein